MGCSKKNHIKELSSKATYFTKKFNTPWYIDLGRLTGPELRYRSEALKAVMESLPLIDEMDFQDLEVFRKISQKGAQSYVGCGGYAKKWVYCMNLFFREKENRRNERYGN